MYSSSYFSSTCEEVNRPAGKESSITFQILPPTESRLGVCFSSSIFIKSINSNNFRTLSLVTFPSISNLYLAPSGSSTFMRIRFCFILEISEDLVLTLELILQILLTNRFVKIH
ncbi:uncharacterized protein METZ01_LOCUS133411 [marine metagenome]|uniref:Uncharacterized protein n=1 Tax=marine metagenome TaxID=408172 RepID=A0A381YVQ6_9ZZZZ